MAVSDFELKQIIVHEAQTPATDIHVLLSGIARLIGISPSGGRGSLAVRARGVLFHICGLRPELKQRFWWEAASRSRVGVLALEHFLAVVSSSNPANTAQVLNELYGRAVSMFGRYPGWSGRNLRRRVGSPCWSWPRRLASRRHAAICSESRFPPAS
jgi:hypothetical protein